MGVAQKNLIFGLFLGQKWALAAPQELVQQHERHKNVVFLVSVLTTFVKQPFQSIIIIYDWQQDEIDYKLNIVFQSYISMKIDIYEPN